MRTQVIYYLFHPSPDYTTDKAGGRLVIAALYLLECSHYGLQEPELLGWVLSHQLDIVVIHVTCRGDLAVQRHRLVAFAVMFLLAMGFALYIACPHTQSLLRVSTDSDYITSHHYRMLTASLNPSQ